jgi:glycosyltransferase involved in cell wall biosynthesis
VIANGVDVPPVATDVRGEPAVGLMVANLNPWKGHADLVAAMQLLGSPPRIRCIGAGVEADRLHALVREVGLSDRVVFEGAVLDAAGEFAGVEFGVLASHREGLPNAVLEAMAVGVPMVATAVGGVPELITDEVDGLLVPPHDPAALAAAIGRMATDRALRVRLGEAARRTAEAYAWDACADRHLELYENVLASVGNAGALRRRLVRSVFPSVAQE